MNKNSTGFAAGAAVCTTAFAALALVLAGCGATDVVASAARSSFASAAEASGNRVLWVAEDAAWSLVSPGGDVVRFAADFSGGTDAAFSFDAAPFVAAGLDLSKLPPSDGIRYAIDGGRFTLGFELGSDAFTAEAKKSMQATFAAIVKSQRDRIGYHAALDHYGIMLGGGNMFEWARDVSKNDKDIVFVLDPAPFIAAGVDPAGLDGWAFAKVETMDEAGKTILVDKLLRPFDLR